MSNSLSLEEFRRILGWNPWHFWGVTDSDKLRVTSNCNDVIRKYAWQEANAVGRDDIESAIQTAENRLAEYLGYHVSPIYRVDLLSWPKFHNREMIRVNNASAAWNRIGVKLPRGYIQKVGLQRLDVINDTVTVTPSDTDGDGIADLLTLSVATSVTDPDEIAIYLSAAERWDGTAASDRWRIRPITVTISGGVATIKVRRWLTVKPALYEAASFEPLTESAAGVFPTKLGVYRLWIDPNGEVVQESQATLIWETQAHGWWCGCGGCVPATVPVSSSEDPAAEAWAVARVGVREARLGIITPAEALLDSTTGIWRETEWSVCPEPDRFRVRYLSGLPLVNGTLDPYWQTLAARMAMAELVGPLCACDRANRELHAWQFDMARAKGANDEQFAISLDDVDNPFGTRRGHIFAWKEVNRRAIGVGFAV